MNITHGNILAVFFSANTAEVTEGLNWYRVANSVAIRLAKQSNLEGGSYATAAIIAVLSPNNKWARNVHDAEALIKVHEAGGDCEAVKVSTYGQNKAKAIRILQGENIPDVLGGRKIKAFYECIVRPENDDTVCVDGHAYSIWLGQKVSTSKTPTISAKLYETISRDYGIATKQINLITGEQYTPAQVQAVTWTAWRNLIKKGAE